MIIYNSTKKEFRDDVRNNQIEVKIHDLFQQNLGHKTSSKEVASWQNSMMYMSNILEDKAIPDDAGVAIEYILPRTSKRRIDFIVTGKDENERNNLVIIELKQWKEIYKTVKTDVVESFVGGGRRELTHPSYQAWSYATFMKDYCYAISEEDIKVSHCAYLHNCNDEENARAPIYQDTIERSPLFLRDDAQKLTDFIKKHVRKGDDLGLLYKIDSGLIKPTKKLADAFSSMIKGNREFVMIDEQKLVYEQAVHLVKNSDKKKNVLIVQGGPGTGKSVVAINLLVKFIGEQLNTQYVTKTEAPRDVLEAKLTGSMKKSRFNSLFVGSGRFEQADKNLFDVLIADESHRLMKKTQYSKNGENQVKEIINAARCSIFFIDEDQRVSLADIGSKEEIKKWAKKFGATVSEMELESQFRCNGSDGYLGWLDNILDIKETANESIKELDYDFKVFDDPYELHEKIKELDSNGLSARTVGGYCWEWKSQNNAKVFDVELGKLKMQWNRRVHGGKWIIDPKTISEIGSIHRCQGLEVDYIGVIIGPDLIVRDGKVITDAHKRHHADRTIFGFKKLFKQDPEKAKTLVDPIIKNTYRTLMTRGMKGCYVYSTDEETNEYFKQLAGE